MRRKGEDVMGIIRSKFQCTREQLTIRGTEYRPADIPASEQLPAVIISHGFMANQRSVKHYAKQFAKWGYAAYIYDFCGGCIRGKSDGKTTDMSVLTEKEDLKAVMAYVKERPYVDPARIVLMGCSQGGFVSGLTAAELQDQVWQLIMFYPALSIPDGARAGEMLMARFDPKNIPETIQCGPMLLGHVYPEAAIDMDPNEEITKYPGPVLILHGTKDDTVPISYSMDAADAFDRIRGKDDPKHELLVIEGGKHGFSRAHDKIAMDGVKRFLME